MQDIQNRSADDRAQDDDAIARIFNDLFGSVTARPGRVVRVLTKKRRRRFAIAAAELSAYFSELREQLTMHEDWRRESFEHGYPAGIPVEELRANGARRGGE